MKHGEVRIVFGNGSVISFDRDVRGNFAGVRSERDELPGLRDEQPLAAGMRRCGENPELKRCPECNREMRPKTGRTPESAWRCKYCESTWEAVPGGKF